MSARKRSQIEILIENTKNVTIKEICPYADSYYTSIPLGEMLKEDDTYLCGTLRKNAKGIPKEVLTPKLKKGEIIGLQNLSGVKIVRWKDKRDVLTISTCDNHDKSTVEIEIRGRKIQKPQIVIDYNKAKKGVDISDQMSSYQTALRRGLKWYRKTAFELITGTAIVNSWILYQKATGKKISILKFKENLCKLILKDNAKPIHQKLPRCYKHKLEKVRERRRCTGCVIQI